MNKTGQKSRRQVVGKKGSIKGKDHNLREKGGRGKTLKTTANGRKGGITIEENEGGIADEEPEPIGE